MVAQRAIDLVKVIKKIREFFASQGFMGRIVADMMLVVDVKHYHRDGKDFLELMIKIPEPSETGLVFTTKKILYDVEEDKVVDIWSEEKTQ